MPLPSELPFVSFLQYSSRGTSDLALKSRSLVNAIKNDSVTLTQEGQQRIIPYSARRLARAIEEHECLSKCFQGKVVVVPVPRSAPLVVGGLWPGMQLCEAIVAQGIAAEAVPLLQRRVRVQKAATAARGQRPSPEEHYVSIGVDEQSLALNIASHIVIADDVITRGATMLACHARVSEALPDKTVSCFALVRTISPGDIEVVVDPVSGLITTEGHLHREP